MLRIIVSSKLHSRIFPFTYFSHLLNNTFISKDTNVIQITLTTARKLTVYYKALLKRKKIFFYLKSKLDSSENGICIYIEISFKNSFKRIYENFEYFYSTCAVSKKGCELNKLITFLTCQQFSFLFTNQELMSWQHFYLFRYNLCFMHHFLLSTRW